MNVAREKTVFSKRELLARFVENPPFGFLSRRLRLWRGILTLNWHRIGHGADSAFDRSLWSATPDAFEAQVRTLKQDFDIIRPNDLADVFTHGNGRYVLLTFDDGYRDNYEQAFPILKAHGVPATFFISTGFLDHPRLAWWDEVAWMVRQCKTRRLPVSGWLDRPLSWNAGDCEPAIEALLRRYKMLPGCQTESYLNYLALATGSGRFPSKAFENYWMTWDMVRALQRGGMAIGGHTVSHPVLARLPREHQAREIRECGMRIAEELGEPMAYFSYPVGAPTAFDKETQNCMVREGVQFAFSYYGGYCRFDGWDPLNIPRTPVETYFSPSRFRSIVTLPQLFA
jgi:peptidoglycan/xylan/chitin deacetylase (PgdA/CDA1 family)